MTPLFTLIKGPVLKSCRFDVGKVSDLPKETITLGLGLSVNAKINDDKNQLRISMTTTTEGAASLFRFNVRMVATFKINKKMATDKINEKAKIECAPFVFGVVRDFIADLTRRSGHAALYLPSPDFTQAAESETSVAAPKKSRTQN